MKSTSKTSIVLNALGAVFALTFTAAWGTPPPSSVEAPPPAYRSPAALAISPDGATLYVSDRTAGCVAVMDLASRAKRREISVHGNPRGLALSADGSRLYVAERGAATVAVIDTATQAVTSRIPVGRWPVALLVVSDRLYVCNQDRHTVSIIGLSGSAPRPVAEVPAVREPCALAATPDQRQVAVANLLALGVASDPRLAAEVTLIDAPGAKVSSSVRLPPGSTALHGICISPDGKWAYVVHQLSRFTLPVTQLERGWVNTDALSLIDMASGRRVATLLLDDLYQGAANPSAVICSRDGQTLWIAHAGVHQISVVRIGLVQQLLGGHVPPELAQLKDGDRANIWVRLQDDPRLIEQLENDLTALYIAGAIRRFPSGGNGPRALILSPDEQQLLVANYYSGAIAILDPATGKPLGQIALGPQPAPDAVRRGEMIFHDATRAFQHWHSCASCHPNDGRADGLRWDFLRDGIGNPKDTPSLVGVGETEPLNRLATREDAREGARTGMLVSHMVVPTEQEVEDLFAYITSLRPEPNPNRMPGGRLSPAARRGQTVFDGKAGCVQCHPPPYFTNKKTYDVGTHTENDPPGGYDTPTLIEAFRTAPYLHDGRALTIRDVLTRCDPDSQHGNVRSLSEQEIDDLVEYVLSL